MLVVQNDYLPIGKKAMTVYPFVFIKNGCRWGETDVNHEEIHGIQQLELLVVGGILSLLLSFLGYGWWSLSALLLFYWWYGTEWLVRRLFKGNAYRDTVFEQEAYDNEHDLQYLSRRRPFAWTEYYFGTNVGSHEKG